jgi:hypothetical protein
MAEKAFEPVGIMAPQIFGLPVDRESMFSNHKKVYKKRTEKRQRKLIIKLPFLNRIFTDHIPGSICNGIFICLSETIPVRIYQLSNFSCAHDRKL